MTSYFAQILTIQYFTLSWFQGKYFDIQLKVSNPDIRVHNLHKSSLLLASDPDFKAQILPSCRIILPRFQVTYSEFLVSYQDFRVHTLPVFALLPILSCPDFRVKNFEIQMSDIGSPILISGYILCKNLFSILCYLAQISRCMILISGYIPWNQGFLLCTNQLSLL